MFARIRRPVCLAAVATAAATTVLAAPLGAQAQNATFTACTTGVLQNCAELSLTSEIIGGLDYFHIAITNLGSLSSPSTATSIYTLAFLTGGAGSAESDVFPTPTAIGGASITDPSAWNVFDYGDAIFLSAAGNNGVGGCVAHAPVGGVGQMGNTCAWQAIDFSFTSTNLFDLRSFSLADMEVVGLIDGVPVADLPTDSCNIDAPCAISGLVVSPEPSSLALIITGLAGVAAVARRRRSREV